LASSARTGSAASRTIARLAVAMLAHVPNFAGDVMVMDNPYLQSQAAVWGKGYSDAADTRPIATRWQREKSVKMMNSLKDKGAR
jgi:hypothetical protein